MYNVYISGIAPLRNLNEAKNSVHVCGTSNPFRLSGDTSLMQGLCTSLWWTMSKGEFCGHDSGTLLV